MRGHRRAVGPCFTRPWGIAARCARKPREACEPLDHLSGKGLARGAAADATPGLAPVESDIVDKGAVTPRLGYAHPTAAPALPGPEPRAAPLAIRTPVRASPEASSRRPDPAANLAPNGEACRWQDSLGGGGCAHRAAWAD